MIWRLLLFELIVLIVVAGVWLLAPLVGITSVFWRIVIIAALILPPIIYVIARFVVRRRAAKGLGTALERQGRLQEESARPDRRDEIRQLNDGFAKAIAGLKKSRLGGTRGTALYALPWYMIIGPPAVGKTTALLKSGLRFPFSPGERKSIKGVGGTRNCDWWFSEQAVLLDTAGRYTSEDDDQDEWQAFLRMVKKYRAKRPLNGLLVAVSVADVVTARTDELEELAEQIRTRIDQVLRELQVSLPIYLLLTKCDLLAGFVEFFGDLKQSARSQVFGFTVPLTDAQTDIEPLVQGELDLLHQRLRDRALTRMARAGRKTRGAVFQFPLQFGAAREALASFVSQLLAPNPYQEVPRLRGVYFCSGTQEGRPIDRVMAAMASAVGLRELGDREIKEQTTKKSYFLRDVFTKILFPDQDLAGRTAAGHKRRLRLQLLGAAGAVLFSVSIVALVLLTFSNNLGLVRNTLSLANDSRVTTPDDPRQVTESLKALDRLGQRVDLLRSYERDGAPWSHSLGFYRGDDLFEPAEAVYIRRMKRVFVQPAGTELEAALDDVASSPDAQNKDAGNDFDLLKAYLMVTTERKRLDVEFAANVLIGQWKKQLHPDVAQQQELLKRNAQRYLRLLKYGRAKWLDHVPTLVLNVRQALRARDAEYRRLIGDASRLLRPLTVRDALRGRIQALIEAQYDVPGVYTRRGWSRYMRSRLAKESVSDASVEPWVLGEEESEALGKRMRDRYYGQYSDSWKRFLRGLSLRRSENAQAALELLERLTDPPSLYHTLFESIVYNTRLPLVDKPKGIKGGGRGAQRLLPSKLRRGAQFARRTGLDKMAANALNSKPQNPVEVAFWPLRELVRAGEGIDGRPQIAGLKQYMEQLDRVREAFAKELKGEEGGDDDGGVERALEEAERVTKGVLASLPGDLRRLVKPLFYAPLHAVAGTAKGARKTRLSDSAGSELCEPFKEKLAGRYPFGRSGRDALFQDVVEYFAPTGTVWDYYERRLKRRLPRRGNRFVPSDEASVPGHVVAFISGSWRVTRSLFPFGSDKPRLRFEVRPLPAVLSEGSTHQISQIILEIEGKSLTYRNGPPEHWTVEWTGEGRRARLLVRGAGGLREELTHEGDWSLLRLVDRAKKRRKGSWYRLEWSLRNGDIRIPMEFRPARTHNLLFERPRLVCR